MKSSYSSLMQSKYFSPAFNSAIFDGPLRIYFAQFHESLALKVYFLVQQKWPQEFARAKDLSKAAHANVLIMVYPTAESFLASVDSEKAGGGPWAVESWNEDVVIALRGPFEDAQMDDFMKFTGDVLRSWTPRTLDGGRSELFWHNQEMLRSQRGQIVIEYILLLVVAVAIAALLLKGLVSRSESNPGLVVEKWKRIQTEIGGELPDKCAGDSCAR